MEKTFVKEARTANPREQGAVYAALAEFGEMMCLGDEAYLYGRYDAPYGWYVFGIDRLAPSGEKYIILGDVLDVLPDYDRVLTLDEVHEFMYMEMDGRYEAAQEWGLFQPISMGLKRTLCDLLGEEALEEGMVCQRGRWMMKYEVCFTTDRGGEEKVTITIPAQSGTSEEADSEFMSEWNDEYAAYDVAERYGEYNDVSLTAEDAIEWAESKERAMWEIRRAVERFVCGVPDGRAEGLRKATDEKRQEVFVLNIVNPYYITRSEVHRTFEGCVKAVFEDVKTRTENFEDYDTAAVECELAEATWTDENTDMKYEITRHRVRD